MLNSLFFRMRFIHYVGIVLLIVNGTFFTDNIVGQIIQYVIAVVILVHDLDEKINGVDMTKSLINQLENLEHGEKVVLKNSFNSELTEASIEINKFQKIFLDAQNSDNKSHEIETIVHKINSDYANTSKSIKRERELLANLVSMGEEFKSVLSNDLSDASKSKDNIIEVSQKLDSVKDEISEIVNKLQELLHEELKLFNEYENAKYDEKQNIFVGRIPGDVKVVEILATDNYNNTASIVVEIRLALIEPNYDIQALLIIGIVVVEAILFMIIFIIRREKKAK